jgi:hypothetical protein
MTWMLICAFFSILCCCCLCSTPQVTLSPSFPTQSDFFALEFLRPPPLSAPQPLRHPCYTLNMEYSRAPARIYNFELAPGASTGQHSWPFFAAVLSLTGGKLSSYGEGSPFADGSLQQAGAHKWVEGGVAFDVRNEGSEVYKAVVVELLSYEL